MPELQSYVACFAAASADTKFGLNLTCFSAGTKHQAKMHAHNSTIHRLFSLPFVHPLLLTPSFRAWAGKSSDINYYLNSHHIDVHNWMVSHMAHPTRVTALAATGARALGGGGGAAGCSLLPAPVNLHAVLLAKQCAACYSCNTCAGVCSFLRLFCLPALLLSLPLPAVLLPSAPPIPKKTWPETLVHICIRRCC